MPPHKKISLVIPAYNEEESIHGFVERVMPIMACTGYDFEMVFVDDGSSDRTSFILSALAHDNDCVRFIKLSRNFGKEAALTAGLSYATGGAIIPMDCDLQDPPELIPHMIDKWEEGYKVVHALRRSRLTDSWLKRESAKSYYRVMSSITDISIPRNCGDYRLMDRVVVEAILSFRERNRFMKGIMAAAGFKAATLEYDRPERSAGETKFNVWKLWNFALDGITSFSTVPLRVWTYLGAMIALCAFVYAGWIVFKTLYWGTITPGFATLMSVVLFLGGVQLIGIGVLGEYIGRLVAETKQRPLFIVESTQGYGEALDDIRPFHSNASKVLYARNA